MRGGQREGAGRKSGSLKKTPFSDRTEQLGKRITKEEKATLEERLAELREGCSMKTESQIREELKATQETLKNYNKAYQEGKISLEVLSSETIDCTSTIDALLWVLGENDRYD